MVKIYENTGQFLAANTEALLESEALSQLVLANVGEDREKACSKDYLFGTVFDKGEILIIFCNVAPWNLVVYAFCKEIKKVALAAEELARYLSERKIEVAGINANVAVCRQFLNAYDAGGRVAKRYFAMDIMECQKLKPVGLQQGIYRYAVQADLDWITESLIAFEAEALGEKLENSPSLREGILKNQIKAKTMRLFCLPHGEPVAMANRSRRLPHGCTINMVYTLPDERGKGYAQTLIHRVCEELFLEGCKFVTLFVDKTNPVSNRVYEKVGFEILEENCDYRFV